MRTSILLLLICLFHTALALTAREKALNYFVQIEVRMVDRLVRLKDAIKYMEANLPPDLKANVGLVFSYNDAFLSVVAPIHSLLEKALVSGSVMQTLLDNANELERVYTTYAEVFVLTNKLFTQIYRTAAESDSNLVLSDKDSVVAIRGDPKQEISYLIMRLRDILNTDPNHPEAPLTRQTLQRYTEMTERINARLLELENNPNDPATAVFRRKIKQQEKIATGYFMLHPKITLEDRMQQESKLSKRFKLFNKFASNANVLSYQRYNRYYDDDDHYHQKSYGRKHYDYYY
jgi:hypothetical protein